MTEVIVSFGPIPEVPAGYAVHNRHRKKLVTITYERKSREWDDVSLLHRHLHKHVLVTASVIYVHVGETACITRAEAWLLVQRILKEVNGHKELIRVVTSFEGFEDERDKAEKLGVEVIEVKDQTGQAFFRSIVRKYRSRDKKPPIS